MNEERSQLPQDILGLRVNRVREGGDWEKESQRRKVRRGKGQGTAPEAK